MKGPIFAHVPELNMTTCCFKQFSNSCNFLLIPGERHELDSERGPRRSVRPDGSASSLREQWRGGGGGGGRLHAPEDQILHPARGERQFSVNLGVWVISDSGQRT